MSISSSPILKLTPIQAWVAFGVIVALNLLLKGLYLSAQDIALDEPFTLFWAQQPLGNIWELAKNENNPPLHFVVEHFMIKLFGLDPWNVRLPSLIFSSLTAGLMFQIGNRHVGWLAGLASAVVFSISTEHIFFSHEARAYAMLCMLTLLAMQAYLRLLEEPLAWRHYGMLVVWNTLLIFTHFLGFWVLLAQVLGWILLPEKRKVVGRLALMFVGVVVLYLPNVPAMLLRLQSVKEAGGTWVERPHWTQLYGHINIFLNGKWGTVGLILVVGMGILALTFQKKWTEWLDSLKGNKVLGMAVLWFGLIYFGMFVQSLIFSPTFIPRYLIFSSIPLFIGIGLVGSGFLLSTRLQMVALGIMVVAMLPGLDLNPPNNRDMKGLVKLVKREKQPEVPLIVCPGYFDKALMYHYDRVLFRDFDAWETKLPALKIFPVSSWEEVPKELVGQAKKVLFLDADAQFTLPENGVLPALQSHFSKTQKQHVAQIFDVYVMER